MTGRLGSTSSRQPKPRGVAGRPGRAAPGPSEPESLAPPTSAGEADVVEVDDADDTDDLPSGWREPTSERTATDQGFPTRTRVLVVALLLLLVAAAAGVWALTRGGPEAASPPPRAQLSSPAVGTAPEQARTGTTFTRVRVTENGDLEVDQWVRSTDFLFGMSVSTPTDSLLPPGSVRATAIRVVADGAAAAGPTELVDGVATYPLDGARQVHLSYLLSGVLERSDTEPGRALARVTSLDVSFQPRSQRSTIEFVGATLLALACQAEYADAPAKPCGVRSGDGWKVDLPADSQGYQVMAQLDLPGELG